MPRKSHPNGRYHREVYAAQKRVVEDAVFRERGNFMAAARYLEIQVSTLYQILRRLGIDRNELRERARAAYVATPRLSRPDTQRSPSPLAGRLALLVPEVSHDDPD